MKTRTLCYCLSLVVIAMHPVWGQTPTPTPCTGVDRYWVGNSGNWSDSPHWSCTSGGTGGASVPTLANTCVFDASSFSAPGAVVTGDIQGTCLDYDATAVLNMPSFGLTDLVIAGSFRLAAGLTWAPGTILFAAAGGSHVITSAGIYLGWLIIDDGQQGATYTLTDNLVAERVRVHSATIHFDAMTVTLDVEFKDIGSAPDLLVLDLAGATIHAPSVLLDRDNLSGLSTFTGSVFQLQTLAGPLVNTHLGTVTILPGGGGISESSTFTVLELQPGSSTTVVAGTTQTVDTLVAIGHGGNRIVLGSDSPGSPWAITCTAPVCAGNFLDVTDSDCSSGSPCYAGANGTVDAYSAAHNWLAEDPPTPIPMLTPTSTETATSTVTPTFGPATRTPRPTQTVSAGGGVPSPTPGAYSHVTALELTLLTKDADLPRYASDCVANGYPTGPYDSLCRCVLYVKRIVGVDSFAYKCPDGVERIVNEVQPIR